MSSMEWDAFISHASEDKDSLVQPLAEVLSAFGVRVWYDRFSLSYGDSLSRSIDAGLANSRFGIVILSPLFLEKRWPEYELRGLTAREMEGGKMILPVWHRVTREQLLRFSPPLADKFAIQADQLTTLQLAVAVIEVIRPDILTRIHRRLSYYRAMEGGRLETVELKKLKVIPIRHEKLPPELISRIRLIRVALLPVYPHSMKFWLEGFQRDAHPSREVAVWEHIAAVFVEFCAMTHLDRNQIKVVFDIVADLSNAVPIDQVRNTAAILPEGSLEKICALFRHAVPVYDIQDEVSFEDLPAGEPPAQEVDTENFPGDLPENLVRQLLREGLKPGDDA